MLALMLGFAMFLLCAPALLSACRDIAKVDFRSAVIVASTTSGNTDYGLFNGPGPEGPLPLRDALEPDWKTSIETDTLLYPAGSRGIRVLTLFRVHMTGTGSFTYVFAFDCRSGKLNKIFEASGEGVRLEQATANSIHLKVGIWSEQDPHAGPSRVEQLRYEWSPMRRKFLRTSSKSVCPWLP